MVDYRYRNRVQSIVSADAYHRSLESWAKKGFTNHSLGKDDLELSVQLEKRNGDVRDRKSVV